ncbi:MAG: hypothetical protein NC397_09315 [Clostridium sp.]|nr:hypothetical protein [Clostridium sp.]
MNNRRRKPKNSGIARFYVQNNSNPGFRAKINAKSLDDLKFIKSQFYSIETIRQEDIAFAEAITHTVSMKIRINIDETISPSYKAVVGNTLYDILKIDHDYYNRDSYIYLEEVVPLEGT